MPRRSGSPMMSSTCTPPLRVQWLASADQPPRGSPMLLRSDSSMTPGRRLTPSMPRKRINVLRARPTLRGQGSPTSVEVPESSPNVAETGQLNEPLDVIFRELPLDQSGALQQPGASIVRAVKWQCPEECSLIPPGVYRALPNALLLDFDVFVLGFGLAFDVIGLEGPRHDLNCSRPTPPYPHSPARRRNVLHRRVDKMELPARRRNELSLGPAIITSGGALQ
ncbi:hypothetical protein EV714DRAFT_273500 [Schizophyllum commune]